MKKYITPVFACTILACAGIPLIAQGGVTPNIRPLNIASVPLYAATSGEKPVLALALSVEFPTAGAQYVDQPNTTKDASYAPTTEYIGYYNSNKCYAYINNPAETPVAGKTKADYKRFQISGEATDRKCDDAFSGNFLNWASSSAVDMLRLALSGGDRSVDESNLTLLQRAVLPSGAGAPSCFWGSANFPYKKISKGSGDFMGTIPKSMRADAVASNLDAIWVANALNKIYFAPAPQGACHITQLAHIGGDGPAAGSLSPVLNAYAQGSLPASAVVIPSSGLPSGKYRIWYGTDTAYTAGDANRRFLSKNKPMQWVTAYAAGSFTCDNGAFQDSNNRVTIYSDANATTLATFTGDPAPGLGKKCYYEPTPITDTWAPVQTSVQINTDGFFYARAEVCGKENGVLNDVRDFGLCTQYPNGNYKPTGTIQKYSDQLRLAAFGYAAEQTLSYSGSVNGRYGGVMRAPMSFVGPRTFNKDGAENTPLTGNPTQEWNPLTGIFVENPENNSNFPVSGVINYLNRFGRTGIQGMYKMYDPSAELYYETMRYLQGLPPTPAAVERLDVTNATQKAFYDGFPIYTDWSNLDPYGGSRDNKADYSCAKSNIALIGDVNTHDSRRYGSNRIPGKDIANNVPDLETWIGVVNSFEKGANTSYVDGQGAIRTTKNPNPNSSIADTYGPQVYGLAYWAHTHDIRGKDWTANPALQRPGLRVKSFFFDVNEYALESPVTKRRNNNQYYRAGKYGGFFTQPAADPAQPYNTKGNPFYDQNDVANNNVWQEPTNVGEPQTYFLQSNARGVLQAFNKIFSEAASAQRSIAGAASASTNLTSGGSFSYQASFDTSSWWGDVQAFSLGSSATGGITLSSTPAWSATNLLEQRIKLGSNPRNIIVGKRGANPAPAATDFKTSAIEADLQADLNRPTIGGAVDGLWQDRLAYIRGEKTKEGSPFRVRYHALGDIVNSGIQYVNSPSTAVTRGAGYAAFASANANRGPVLYVGANDGMMHAFNAKTGDEVFGYIPSWVGPNLSDLTNASYVHEAYVDATPVIGDAKIGAGVTAADWKTVLVSGSGGGGKGVFALDVTNPSAFNASNVMWEFTQANDADMGFVLGKPRIVQMRTSSPTGTSSVYRWFAMVPAGANNYLKVGQSEASASGNPTIFLLALDKPPGEAWINTGSAPNYYKISLPYDSSLVATTGTGADAITQILPTGIINLEAYENYLGITEYVYAGDLHGKLWALDFTGFGADNWNAGNLSRFSAGTSPNLTPYPMFIAKDKDGNIQPITAAPSIVAGAVTTTHFVGFGTGKYIEATDASSTQKNTYYTLYDNGSGAATSGTSGVVGIAGRGRLQGTSLDSTTNNLATTQAFTWGRPTSDSSTSARAGWFYDLPEVGERVVYDSSLVSFTSKVAFSSLIPDAAKLPGVCSISGGSGNNYLVDLVSGSGLVKASVVGVSGQPLISYNDETTVTTKADSTGRRLRTVPIVVTQQGSNGLNSSAVSTAVYPMGRLSWRQVNNYQELHLK